MLIWLGNVVLLFPRNVINGSSKIVQTEFKLWLKKLGSFYNVLYLLFGFLKVFSVCIFETEMSFSFFADCSISDISSLLFVFGTEQQASSSGCCWSCSPLRFFCNSASCFSSYCFNTMISFLCSLYT